MLHTGSAARLRSASSPPRDTVSKQRSNVIRASEIGEYVYCARSWWLRRVAGWEPAGRERREHGSMLHRRHGQAVAGSTVLLVIAGVLVLVALALLLLGRT